MDLSGNGSEFKYKVNLEIKFDTDQVFVSTDYAGNRIVLNGKFSTTIDSSYDKQSTFAGGSATLNGVSGKLCITNSERILLIPWTSIPSTSDEVQLEIPINRADVVWLENARNGSDLTGTIHLHGTISVKSKSYPIITKNEDGQDINISWNQHETIGIKSPNHQNFQIEREKWINMLSKLGVGSYVVELPIIDLKRRKDEWKKVIQFFDQAMTDFRNGDLDRTIETCRKIVEGIVTVISAAWKIQPNSQHVFEQKVESMLAKLQGKWPEESKSRIEALSQLINAIWKWSGPYHHFEGALPHRQEASFILHLTANLVEVSAFILEDNPFAKSEGK